jgi:hypothetical protein
VFLSVGGLSTAHTQEYDGASKQLQGKDQKACTRIWIDWVAKRMKGSG